MASLRVMAFQRDLARPCAFVDLGPLDNCSLVMPQLGARALLTRRPLARPALDPRSRQVAAPLSAIAKLMLGSAIVLRD